ncbi:hypothetical protein T11_1830 [Trichinella zimbabwensis]|uniref:Uncharacterized protein n=1 Tax=Trichinella zimbabwensis TaxID=268475 RepID=A0A0V1GD35_9BILA|nr:hypothetical protein T11_1830 [Trichinella zimbabwensis]
MSKMFPLLKHKHPATRPFIPQPTGTFRRNFPNHNRLSI